MDEPSSPVLPLGEATPRRRFVARVMGTPWIGGQFQEYIFQGEDGSLWMMGKQISEKLIKSNPLSDSIYNTSEAQAVFRCWQIRGPGVGKRAIVKVRMQ